MGDGNVRCIHRRQGGVIAIGLSRDRDSLGASFAKELD
jgi:hypothetical protein